MATQDTTLTYSASLGLDQQAWDRVAHFALRAELMYDKLATEGPTKQSMPGSVVTFRFVNDLAVATTPLDERTDKDAVIPSSTPLSITLAEYGNVVKTTAFHKATGYIPLDPVVANLIGYNAGDTQDVLASNQLHAGTNVVYAGGKTARNLLNTTDKLTAADVRRAVAKLRGEKVKGAMGSKTYFGTIHPDVSVDFRTETGAANWRDPHTYSAPQNIWEGEVGIFEGVRFVESPRAGVVRDAGADIDGAGAGTALADVYQTLILGSEALAKAFPIVGGHGPNPHVVPGPVTDNLRRFVPMGWYWIGAYKIFRQEAVRRIESGSSLDNNATG